MAINSKNNGLVPQQAKGAKSDTCQSVDFKSKEEAISFYGIAKMRLQDVSNWHKLCGLVSATFTMIDSSGNKIRRLIKEGDYIRIDIPGPGSKIGHGFDWVRIEAVTAHHDPIKDIDQIALRVRPAKNPKEKVNGTAHFFKKDATSTFMVVREMNKVTAEIHGRNELPNIKQVVKMDSIRNTLIAIGAMIGLSKWQWSNLAKGIVSTDDNSNKIIIV